MAGESIYNLIPQPVPPVIKPERYISKHSGDKPPTFSTFGLTGTSKPGYQNVAGAEMGMAQGHHVFKKSHATMGKEGNARKPADMLKKGSGGGGGAADANAFVSTGTRTASSSARSASVQRARRSARTLPSGMSAHVAPSACESRAGWALRSTAHHRSACCMRTRARTVACACAWACVAVLLTNARVWLRWMCGAGGFKYTDRMRPGLPTKDECKELAATLKANKETKNFVTANAVENILAVPKREVRTAEPPSTRALALPTWHLPHARPLRHASHPCVLIRVVCLRSLDASRRRAWTGSRSRTLARCRRI